jgi:hypothetical protein
MEIFPYNEAALPLKSILFHITVYKDGGLSSHFAAATIIILLILDTSFNSCLNLP